MMEASIVFCDIINKIRNQGIAGDKLEDGKVDEFLQELGSDYVRMAVPFIERITGRAEETLESTVRKIGRAHV